MSVPWILDKTEAKVLSVLYCRILSWSNEPEFRVYGSTNYEQIEQLALHNRVRELENDCNDMVERLRIKTDNIFVWSAILKDFAQITKE